MEKYISPVLPLLKPNFKNKFPIFKNVLIDKFPQAKRMKNV